MSADGSEPDSPALPPEQWVGSAMREARETVDISLRSMAKQLGYHSHTTLSSYERGAVMPTDEAVTGYERILGLAPGTLVDVLEGARIERHGDAWTKRRVHIRHEFAPVAPDEAKPSDELEQPPAPSPKLWPPRWWMAVAGGVIVVGIVTLVVGLLVSQPGAARTAGAVSGIQDGSDPSVTGCAADGVTVDSVDVYDPPEHLVGVLQLRSSRRCGTSWPRFVPEATLPLTPKLTLELDVYRPADGRSAKYAVTYDGLDAYGNMLISSHQCVYAQVTLTRHGQQSLPPVATSCLMATT
jgi:transcriptional regulator with XRE-family HTH domain